MAVAIAGAVQTGPTARGEQEAPRPRPGAGHAVPLYGEIARPYDAPDDPYAAGHRGIDIAAPAGTVVRASAPGTVSFSGVVVGNRTVSVDHGDGIVTTYSFLATASVKKGESVKRGTPVGTVGRGHAGSAAPDTDHVHLAGRLHGNYFDPILIYVGSSYSDLISLTR